MILPRRYITNTLKIFRNRPLSTFTKVPYLSNLHITRLYTSDKSNDDLNEENLTDGIENGENSEINNEDSHDFGEQENMENEMSEVEKYQLIITEYENEINELKEFITTIKDKYTKAIAEQENIRRIAREDMDKARKYGISSFSSQIINVSDSLQMALKSFNTFLETEPDNLDKLQPIYKGIEITNNVMNNVLNGQEIYQMEDPIGNPFDPGFHEAILRYPSPSEELIGTVAEITKVGYIIQDRVLRACQVIVYVDGEELGIKNDSTNSENDKDDKEVEDEL